ncbi:YceI family protein [Aestuariivivens marinum]|uniref:YceI family protein n=1 Tax=Aestuariivivens marinum TaxID=2913555 RepID=UPI001F5AEABA|nr:YceI family protein [Aestuariivivens marinum]
MKNKLPFALIIIVLTFITTDCRNKAKEAETKKAETVNLAKDSSNKFIMSIDESTIIWSGYKPTGSHTGTINLSHGELTINDGKIESGTFNVDMASLKDSEANARLEKHLKSVDFFDVQKYPFASFKITGFENVNDKTLLSGNLTLKDTTNNVTFPVSVFHTNDSVKVESETFTIDRSKWNVRYGSRSFFDNLGEKYINDDIELTIVVKGKKE